MTDSEAVWQFLSDLKDQRAVQKRLRERAAENPEAVLRYIDSLPEGWERSERDEVMWLTELQTIALRALQESKRSSSD